LDIVEPPSGGFQSFWNWLGAYLAIEFAEARPELHKGLLSRTHRTG